MSSDGKRWVVEPFPARAARRSPPGHGESKVQSPKSKGVTARDHERAVLRAEPDAVAEGVLDGGRASLVRHVVEVAGRVGAIEVDRRRQEAVAHGEQRRRHPGRAAGALRMADHGLDRRARQAVCGPPEGAAHGQGLDAVVQLRRGAVVRDVADRLGRHAGFFHRERHRARRLFARLVQTHAVVSVAGRAVAGDLAVNAGPARAGPLGLLENEHPRTLAQHEPVAVGGERPGGGRRVGFARGREDPHHGKAFHDSAHDGRVDAAREHDILGAELDRAETPGRARRSTRRTRSRGRARGRAARSASRSRRRACRSCPRGWSRPRPSGPGWCSTGGTSARRTRWARLRCRASRRSSGVPKSSGGRARCRRPRRLPSRRRSPSARRARRGAARGRRGSPWARKPLSSPAIVAGRPSGSKSDTRPTPLDPARSARAKASRPFPFGARQPMPVTTTLLLDTCGSYFGGGVSSGS